MRPSIAQASCLVLFICSSNAQIIAQTDSSTTKTFSPMVTSSDTGASPTRLSPCGIVSSMSRVFKTSPSAPTHFVPPSVALACLESVPLDAERSSAFIDYIMAYLEFETSLAYLKDPPLGYLVPGVDIMGGLSNVKTSLGAGFYLNQWSLEVDLHELINVLPYNGHLGWKMPLVSKTFYIKIDNKLLSVSTDGLALPEVFVSEDLLQTSHANMSWTPSPVTTINQRPITEYLETIGAVNGFQQDPDAQYNLLFPSIPFTAQGLIGLAETPTSTAYGLNFLGDYTNWTFANGSATTTMNRAVNIGNFQGIDSGSALFSKVDLPPKPTTSSSNGPSTSSVSSATRTKAIPTVTNYPYPVRKAFDDLVAGYFLNGSKVSDIAVLTLLSFEDKQQEAAGALEMQRIIQSFLADCVVAGKTKLIIDLSANAGGVVGSGFDAFKQLFPSVTPFGGSRFRESTVFNFLGDVTSQLGVHLYNSTSMFPWQIQENVDRNLQPFPDWQAEYNSSDDYNGDNFTSLLRYNLSNSASTSPVAVSGYNNRTKIMPQPFQPENIVMLYDGSCASTCTVFSDMMKRQAGVRSIVVGGRPKLLPMQAQGGVKGSQVIKSFTWQQTYKVFVGPGNISIPYNISYPNTIPTLPTGEPPLGDPLSANTQSTNGRNAYPSDNPDGPPLQFIYEAANCRLFYQYEDLLDVTHLWKRVANVVWGNGTCVPGSTINTNNTFPSSATDTVPYNPNVNSNATLPKGAGNINYTLPVSTSATSASTGLTSTASASISSPATSTGGATSLSIGPAFLFGMFSAVLGIVL